MGDMDRPNKGSKAYHTMQSLTPSHVAVEIEGKNCTRNEVSWGSKMLMRLLSPTSCDCIPLQSVWKFACMHMPIYELSGQQIMPLLEISSLRKCVCVAVLTRHSEDETTSGEHTSSFSMRQAKHQNASASSCMTYKMGATMSDMPWHPGMHRVSIELPKLSDIGS